MKFWDELPLGQVTPSKLRDWIGALGVTPKRARNLLTPLRSVFEDALNDELIDYNPFDRIALGNLLRQTTKASDYEVDPFASAERTTLLEHARVDERPMLQFWLNTGLRPGELMALRWGKIDWVGRKARIDRNLVAKTEKGPKTAAGIRDVELNDEAIAALIAQKSATFLGGEHVWNNPRTSSAWETDAQIRKILWEPLCTRSGVRYRTPTKCGTPSPVPSSRPAQTPGTSPSSSDTWTCSSCSGSTASSSARTTSDHRPQGYESPSTGRSEHLAHVRICVRLTCESDANQGRLEPKKRSPYQWSFTGTGCPVWWSRGESNPRPQAILR